MLVRRADRVPATWAAPTEQVPGPATRTGDTDRRSPCPGSVGEVLVTELVGVYDADGGLLGEAAYVWGRLRGTRHCSLCDITHSPWRRKPAWDAMAARLSVPIRLLHRNELDAGLAAVVARVGAPVVLARAGEDWSTIVGADELDAMSGSVDRLGTLLRDRLAAAPDDEPA